MLGATWAEVRRWSKDGRLKTSGAERVTVGRQLLVTPTYAPNLLGRLRDAPEVLADWRARDAAAQREAFTTTGNPATMSTT